MRLTCPNCGAQYEVPSDVIPEEGRDVQCSNCGNTWFQTYPGDETQERVEDDVSQESITPEATQDGEDDGGAVQDSSDDASEAPQKQPKRELDKSILDILREEAALEQQAREREAQSNLETQSELGLEQSDEPAAKDTTGDDINEARPAEDETDAPSAKQDDLTSEAAEDASRRNLLPDIEEINSSFGDSKDEDIDSAEDDKPDIGMDLPPANSRFGTGFILVIAIFMLLAILYMAAPILSDQVPSLAEPLSGYTGVVDGGRAQLNVWISDAVVWFETMSAPVDQE